MDDLGSKSWQE